MDSPSHRVVRFVLLLLVAPLALGQTAEAVAKLEAKGVKVKKDKAGTVREVTFSGKQELALDDWRAIGSLPTLTRVWVSGGRGESGQGLPLNDETAKELANLENLDSFFANAAEMTDDGFKAFAGWRKLRTFGLDHWFGPKGSKGYVGAGLAHLKALPELRAVRLGGCRVDNSAAKALAEVKTLQSVDLFHTFAVTDEGVAALTALPDLRTITLAPQFTPRITDASLAHLGRIRSLEEINVGETWLTYDGGFVHLKGLANLKRVKLTAVVATEADVARLRADLPNVKVEWTPATPEQAEKTKAAFARRGQQRGK